MHPCTAQNNIQELQVHNLCATMCYNPITDKQESTKRSISLTHNPIGHHQCKALSHIIHLIWRFASDGCGW